MSDLSTGIILGVCGVVIVAIIMRPIVVRPPREVMRPGPPDADEPRRRRLRREGFDDAG